jgi:hypothetical protein
MMAPEIFEILTWNIHSSNEKEKGKKVNDGTEASALPVTVNSLSLQN